MQTIESILNQITQCDMSYSLRNAADAAVVLHLYREPIEKFLALEPELNLSVSGSAITLEYAERPALMKFLQCFGGDWEKQVNDYDKTKMDYVQTHLHPLRDKTKDFEEEEAVNEETGEVTTKTVPYKYQRKLTISVVAVMPPPSCVIVEEEIEVPARKELRKRVVCDKAKELEEVAQ